MKTQTKNTIRLVALGLAAVAMFLLVVGLPQMELEPGLPFERIWAFLVEQFGARGNVVGGTGATLPGGEVILEIYRTLFFVALVAFPFAVILVMIDPELRKRVIATTIRILILVALLSLIMRNRAELEDPILENMAGQQAAEVGQPAEPLAVEDFQSSGISPWIGRGLSLALGLLAAFVLAVIITQIRRNRPEPASELDNLALHAKEALSALEDGADLQNTIIRCYAEMTRAVREVRGLRRDRTVTAREFTDALVRARLPRRAVEQLTLLFEKARYGGGATTPQDEQSAIASLRAIVRACEDFGEGLA